MKKRCICCGFKTMGVKKCSICSWSKNSKDNLVWRRREVRHILSRTYIDMTKYTLPGFDGTSAKKPYMCRLPTKAELASWKAPMPEILYTHHWCSCCGYPTMELQDDGWEYDFCQVCGWQDDGFQTANPNDPDGPNGNLCLRVAREMVARGISLTNLKDPNTRWWKRPPTKEEEAARRFIPGGRQLSLFVCESRKQFVVAPTEMEEEFGKNGFNSKFPTMPSKAIELSDKTPDGVVRWEGKLTPATQNDRECGWPQFLPDVKNGRWVKGS